MSARFRTVASCALIAALFFGSAAIAVAVGHGVIGSGTHNTTPHNNNNPTHLWVQIKVPKAGQVSSGGRYHDGCTYLNGDDYLDRCRGATSSPEDFSFDIAGTGTVYLNVNYAGYASGFTVAPKPNTTMTFRGVVFDDGSWSNGNAACQWQKIDIWAVWIGTDNATYNKKIGQIMVGHLGSWTYAEGQTISSNATQYDPVLGLTINYLSQRSLGTVYNGSDGAGGAICSSGPHVHWGMFSYHNFGAQYEWHGEGPDYYWDYHIHGGGGVWEVLLPIDQAASGDVLGFLGGGYTGYSLWDNPKYGDH